MSGQVEQRPRAGTPRGGRAGLWAVLILTGLCALLYVQLGSGDGAAGAGAAGPDLEAAGAPAGPAPPTPAAGPPAAGPRANDPVRADEPLALGVAPPASRATAPGRGRIRGELQVHGKLPLGPWKLHLQPSLAVSGPERATRRTLEFAAGVTEFELADLPLAAYDLMVEATGYNARRMPVLLSPSRGDVAVVLGLFEAGSLGGRVVDAERLPLERLPLVLVPAIGTQRLRTETDPLGGFLFESVPDGPWTLHFGSEQRGVAEPLAVTMSAPGEILPTVEVPRLGRARVRVLDARGRPVEGAHVRGFGPAGGLIDARTDPDGWAWAHFLPLGRYTVRTTVADAGRAVAEFTLESLDDEAPPVVLELRP